MVTDRDPLTPNDYEALWLIWEGRGPEVLDTYRRRLVWAGYIDDAGQILRVTDQGRRRLEGVRAPE
jgi:hypothetical protein